MERQDENRLARTRYDVIVIGGGHAGCEAAAAAARPSELHGPQPRATKPPRSTFVRVLDIDLGKMSVKDVGKLLFNATDSLFALD